MRSIKLNNKEYCVGDQIEIKYKIKEGEKERLQPFKGILIKIKGSSPDNQMITVRKVTKRGIGVERIFPIQSPFITEIKLIKHSQYNKAKAYFIRNLSEKNLRLKLYKKSGKK